MNTTFTNRVDKLRKSALKALPFFEGKYSKHYSPSIGFNIGNDFSRYDELIWINGEWMFIEYGSNQLISAHAIPLEELCQIVDDILEQQKKGLLQ